MNKHTDNFNLDLYDKGDAANLTDQYNSAMHIIDDNMLRINTNAVNAANKADTVRLNLESLGVHDTVEGNSLAQRINTIDNNATTALANNASNKQLIQDTAANLTNVITPKIDKAQARADSAYEVANDTKNNLAEHEKIKNHIVIIGDSFSASNRQNCWAENITKYLTSIYVSHNYAVGGTGFIQSAHDSTFSKQLDDAKNDNAFDNKHVSHVIIYGGYNDWTYKHSSDDEKVAVADTYKKAVSLFPNAKILLCFVNLGNANNNAKYNTIKQWVKDVQGSLYTQGIPFINSMYWLCGYSDTVFEGDNLHPNSTGEGIILSHMTALVQGYQTSGERLVTRAGFDGADNFTEIWFNDITGIVNIYGKHVGVEGEHQTKLASFTTLAINIGEDNNRLIAGSWYSPQNRADSIRAICYSPANNAVYIQTDKNLKIDNLTPDSVNIYYQFTYHA